MPRQSKYLFWDILFCSLLTQSHCIVPGMINGMKQTKANTEEKGCDRLTLVYWFQSVDRFDKSKGKLQNVYLYIRAFETFKNKIQFNNRGK